MNTPISKRGIVVSLNTASTLTMSSLQIAELVGARHDNVKVTIERLAARGVITLPALQEVSNTGLGPKKVKAYLVEKRDSYVVVAQLSPEFTARLVDRWQELEEQQAKTQVVLITASEVSKRFFKLIHPPVNLLLVRIFKSSQRVRYGAGGNLFPCG